MKLKKHNFKLLSSIQALVVMAIGFSLPFISRGEIKNGLLEVCVGLMVSLLIQTLLFLAKPNLFADKTIKYPYKG